MRLRWKKILSGLCAALLAAPIHAADEPIWTDAEMEDFLLRAEIERLETLEIGVTGSQRATLTLDGRTHHAHVQTVDVVQHKAETRGRVELSFRDSYRYNIAAYRLDRLLDLHMVPVSVERRIEGQPAAVTWWVEGVKMMERERIAGQIKPPHLRPWQDQNHVKRVFSQLIDNADLNQGNILITHDWKIWLIDFTRAFRRTRKLSRPAILVKIEGRLLERLRSLSLEQLESALGDCLTKIELRSLLARRGALVEHFDRLVEQRGAAAVIYETAAGTP